MRRQGYHGSFLYETTGGAKWYGNHFWHHPWFVLNCLCEDGKRRVIRLNQEADTAFTWPGRASIGGKTRRGFVGTGQDQDGNEVTMFIAYQQAG